MKKYAHLIWGVAGGTVLFFLSAFVFALLFLTGMLYETEAPFFSLTALALGCLAGGFISARIKRQNGLLTGLAVGGIMTAVVVAISLFSDMPFTYLTLLKVAVCPLCGAIGGVLGVNLFRKRKMI